jgi:hypothetical protein
MFDLHIADLSVHYLGCPRDGIASVDWRRARGLPEAPTSRAGTLDLCAIQSEPLCRMRPAELNPEADLVAGDRRADLDYLLATRLLALPQCPASVEVPLHPQTYADLMALICALWPEIAS